MTTTTPVSAVQMVDLRGQYQRLQPEIDEAIQTCLEQADFINGASVRQFQRALADYLRAKQVITCANGTDALQLALMALDLQPGDEVVVPAFTYVAAAEAVALLGLTPVWADVDPLTFTVTAETVSAALTDRTRAIIPVHLFGQCADMEPLLDLASAHGLFVIEDMAQAIGSEYRFADGQSRSAGTMGQVGCTSFFPSKNLGCYGDGGGICTNDTDLADRLRMLANHGQRQKYVHEVVGVNSRLDTLQAAILAVKLAHLDDFTAKRQQAARRYDQYLADVADVQTPQRAGYSTHVYHQYTLLVPADRRDGLQAHLRQHDIPSMVYYPMTLHQQPAYVRDQYRIGSFPVAEQLCRRVLSLPMHTELTASEQAYICTMLTDFMRS